MTKEYAALLAQVIPVIALAAAIELRSLVRRYERLRKEAMSTQAPEGEPGDRAVRQVVTGVLAWALCAVLPVLAVSEVRVISVVAGHNVASSVGPVSEQVLTNAIAAVFMLPAIGAGIRLWLATTRKRRSVKVKLVISLLIAALFLLLSSFLRWVF
ncbi:hypothetical protein [Actinorhabdospora filicis]|uniref:hypothetical protein n=1 Tax=Actinorhabdospora filicis TaxID=1785913 RepID=UPI002554C15F|nr:hypothetical protein [Actinorhabdospora filicis]